jgi:hypothetical protein
LPAAHAIDGKAIRHGRVYTTRGVTAAYIRQEMEAALRRAALLRKATSRHAPLGADVPPEADKEV